MNPEKVVVTDYIEENLDWEQEQLKEMHCRLIPLQMKSATPGELLIRISDADILVVNMAVIDRRIIEGLKKCRLIIRHGVGYDNVDVAAATEAGIPVSHVPDYCVEEVAEQTVMLLMTLARNLPVQFQTLRRSVRKGEWDFSRAKPLFRIRGKTVGIIGFGRIGSMVFRMLGGFGVRTLVSDPYVRRDRLKEFGIAHTPLDELLREADFVTVNVALTGETFHLLDSRSFARMKKTAFLVHTSRGGVVDQNALIAALQAGQLGGAALDVYEYGEPPPADSPLFKIKNVVLTPHLSWASQESEWVIRRRIVDAVRRALGGEKPEYLLNEEVWRKNHG
jgi:D-3-phosphoglycerate dehydrogenase